LAYLVNNYTRFWGFAKGSLDLVLSKVGFKVEERIDELPVIDLMYPFLNYSEELALEIADFNEGYYSVYIIRPK